MQSTAATLVGQFEKAGYRNSVAQKMHYDEYTAFTDSNVTQYMAEMEEYIGRLVRDVARQQGEDTAGIASLPFDQVRPKIHYAPAMQIEPFEAPTALDTDEELIIDEGELYKKFVKSLEREMQKA